MVYPIFFPFEMKRNRTSGGNVKRLARYGGQARGKVFLFFSFGMIYRYESSVEDDLRILNMYIPFSISHSFLPPPSSLFHQSSSE